MGNLYALLVGIDAYPKHPLHGCVSDIEIFERYLTYRIDSVKMSVKTVSLRNDQATRQAILLGFRSHLSLAGEGDSAVFYFAGHGSQQASAPESWDIEPDHLDETLVCFDSRLPGGSDLSDKELGALIAEIAARNPHITVVLDSCHSSSGTRGTDGRAVRSLPGRFDSPVGRSGATQYDAHDALTTRALSGWRRPLHGRHVLLAACRADQQAWEHSENGRTHGLFSLALMETLEASPGKLSYNALIAAVQAGVSRRKSYQEPQLESTFEEDLNLPFLGGEVSLRPQRYFLGRERDGWTLNAGAVHGVPQPTQEEPLRLALFPADSASPSESAIGRAVVTKVFPGKSSVEMIDTPQSPAHVFAAEIEQLPLPKVVVSLRGEAIGTEQLKRAIASAGMGSGSLFVRVGSIAETPDLIVVAFPDRFEICGAPSEDPLTAAVPRGSELAAPLVAERLEHIATWLQAKQLTNPCSTILKEEFDISLMQGDSRLAPPVRLQGTEVGSRTVPPQFTVRVTNRGFRTLYFGLAALSELFKIAANAQTPCEKLEPGQSVVGFGGGAVTARVHEQLALAGRTETCDTIMAIVATSPFDIRRLCQNELAAAAYRGLEDKASANFKPTSLNLLLNRVRYRKIGAAVDLDDWISQSIAITTLQPRDFVRLAETKADLGFGVWIAPHPQASMLARLANESAISPLEDGAGQRVPRIFQQEDTGTRLCQFVRAVGSDAGLDTVEFAGVLGSESITRDAPLRIVTSFDLKPGERIIPFVFSEAGVLPIGRSETRDGRTQIVLEHLPAAGGRVRFQRLSEARPEEAGEPIRAPQLSFVDIRGERVIEEPPDLARIGRDLFEKGNAVLLLPGPFGRSAGMIPVLAARAGAFVYETPPAISILEQASSLADHLRQAGLLNDKRKIRIFAHSIAGLVARCLIEQPQLNHGSSVRDITMFGTPNDGWSWQRPGDLRLAVAIFAINDLAPDAWSACDLARTLRAIDSFDPLQTILPAAVSGLAPGVAYRFVRGQPFGSGRPWEHMTRLLRALGIGVTGGSDGVALLENVGAGQMRERLDIIDLDCDHFSFFRPRNAAQWLSRLLEAGAE